VIEGRKWVVAAGGRRESWSTLIDQCGGGREEGRTRPRKEVMEIEEGSVHEEM
jgi:hypothetical protein